MNHVVVTLEKNMLHQRGEAKRNDKDYTYVAAWEYKGEPSDAVLHKEELNFENIEVKEKDHTNNKYTMNLKLKIWRQKDANDKGSMVDYDIQNVSEHMSFLEMLDVLNEELN